MLLPLPAHAASVQVVTTDSGITAWLIEEHSQPIISLRAVFTDAGTAYDPQGKEGLAMFTTALLAEGAGERDALAFSKAVEERAVGLSANVDDDYLSLTMQTLTEEKEAAFALLGDMIARPRFEESAVQRVRKQSITALAKITRMPAYRAARAWRQAAYPNHPYGKIPEGTEATVQTFTRADAVQFHQRYIARDNLTVAVVGDITAQELKPLLEKTFAGLPAKAQRDITVPDTKPAGSRTIALSQDVPQTFIIAGLPGIARNDPAFFDAYVLNHIVAGGDLTSRLNRELREKRGLTYGAGMQLDFSRHSETWAGGFSTRAEEAEHALAAMQETFTDVLKNGISEQEVKDAKEFITGSFVLSLDSNADVANFLISMQLNKLGADYLDKRNALVSAVTPESVNAMAKRLIKPQDLLIVTVGRDKAAGKRIPSPMGLKPPMPSHSARATSSPEKAPAHEQ